MDARLVDAIYDLGAVAGDVRSSSHQSLDTIARLTAEAVGADACAVTVCETDLLKEASAVGLHGPWSEAERQRFVHQTRWQPGDRVLLSRLARSRDLGVRPRQDLIDDAEFRRTRLHNEFQRPLGIGNQAVGAYRADGVYVVLGVGRVESEEPMDRRTVEAANWLASHVARATAAVWRAEPAWAVSLSPRCRRVLQLADQGLDDHQIAERLGVTYHTARAHLKRVFRAAGVRSRLHLMQQYRASADRAGSAHDEPARNGD